MDLLNIFLLSCFIGYFAIWHVSPILHASLMSVTNAISGIVILGAIQAFNEISGSIEIYLLYSAIFFASLNIFGGFYVSLRMLDMFKIKDKDNE